MQNGNATIVFLGTGSSNPVENRWLPSILLKIRNSFLLLDCGEGSQYRILKAGLRVNKLSAILITHLHGDHIYGLPGLLESLEMWGRTKPLPILGPPGVRDFLNATVLRKALDYGIEIREISPGLVLSEKGYNVYAIAANHGVDSYAYVIVESNIPGRFNTKKANELGLPPGPLRRKLVLGEPVTLPDGTVVKPEDVVGKPRKGLKIVYSGDTSPCDRIIEASLNADVLIHEATFSSTNEYEARASFHSTAIDAAQVASHAAVKLLLLTHFSSRYVELTNLLNEARTVFKRTYLSKDMLKVELKRWVNEWLLVEFETIK
ncbi:MAG: ribonuclease Z [Thermofilaceae archaeon]|nr:ribonuclease Z [Thermofilaceae archaeon]MDW8004488.1 ribonuclease Z [Thermofilaceae archaeon]